MIEFGGDNAGHPWHGLYKGAIDKISTPAGGDIDPPGARPDGGDCWLVQIPGLPVPVTSPDEAAEGKTWLNYALISDGILYGKRIDGPLFVDDDGRPWLLIIAVSGTRASKALTVNVSARRFGVVGSAVAPTNALPPMTVAFNTHPNYPVASGEFSGAHVLDVALNGRRFLVGVTRARGYSAVAEVVLTGTPEDGSFAANIELLADESSDEWPTWIMNVDEPDGRYHLGLWWEYDWSAPASPFPDGTYPTAPMSYYDINGVLTYYNGSAYSTHRSVGLKLTQSPSSPDMAGWLEDGYYDWRFYSHPVSLVWPGVSWLCGARYADSSVAEVLTSVVSHRADYDPPEYDTELIRVPVSAAIPMWPSAIVVSQQKAVSTISCLVHADGTEIDGVTDTATVTGDGQNYSVEKSGGSGSGSVSFEASTSWFTGYFAPLIPLPTAYFSTNTASNVRVGVRRATNSVYSIKSPNVTLHATSSNPIRLEGLAHGGTYTGRSNSVAAVDPYVSENPFTGEVAQGDGVVCWV